MFTVVRVSICAEPKNPLGAKKTATKKTAERKARDKLPQRQSLI